VVGWVTFEGRRYARPSTISNKGPKKKVKGNNFLLEISAIKAELSNVNMQVDEDLLASLNSTCV
jgi:hypothetical protein